MVHGKETETGSYITLEWICNVADGWLAQARIFRLIKTLSAAGGLIRTLDITSASSATGGTAVQRGSLFHVIEPTGVSQNIFGGSESCQWVPVTSTRTFRGLASQHLHHA